MRVALRLVLGLHRVEERRRRDLGVDDDVLAARQADDQVGREPAAVGGDRLLDVEVAVLQHPRRFDDAPQLELAPLAAHVGRAERLDQPAGLDLQRLLRGVERLQLFGDRRLRADAVLLDLLELAVDQVERLLERLDEVLDGLLPAGQLDPRGLLELAERGPGQRQERLVVLAQRLGRQRREGVAHPRFGLAEQHELFGRGAPLGRNFSFEPGAILLRRAELALELADLCRRARPAAPPARLLRRADSSACACADGERGLEPGGADRPLAVQPGLQRRTRPPPPTTSASRTATRMAGRVTWTKFRRNSGLKGSVETRFSSARALRQRGPTH